MEKRKKPFILFLVVLQPVSRGKKCFEKVLQGITGLLFFLRSNCIICCQWMGWREAALLPLAPSRAPERKAISLKLSVTESQKGLPLPPSLSFPFLYLSYMYYISGKNGDAGKKRTLFFLLSARRHDAAMNLTWQRRWRELESELRPTTLLQQINPLTFQAQKREVFPALCFFFSRCHKSPLAMWCAAILAARRPLPFLFLGRVEGGPQTAATDHLLEWLKRKKSFDTATTEEKRKRNASLELLGKKNTREGKNFFSSSSTQTRFLFFLRKK